MADAPDWPKVLSLAVHEFRTPLTVVAGYLRMLSTDRVGPLSDAQRRVIQEAEKSCAKLSALITEVSDVAHFHQGRLTFLRSPVPLSGILDNVAVINSAGDRLAVSWRGSVDGILVNGDAERLAQAVSAVATAVAREIMDDDPLCLVADVAGSGNAREARLSLGTEAVTRAIADASRNALPSFDITRGGLGLSLVVAQQVIEDHGGDLRGAPGERPKAGAAIALPLS